MRIAIASSLIVLTLGSLAGLAADPPRSSAKPANGNAASRDGRVNESAAAREAAVIAFVRENHPELADLLEQLKAMKPEQYEKAIAELSQVSRMLANTRKNEPARYVVALDVWKARSRAELIAAQLAGTPSTELEGQLRSALENQVAAEIRQQLVERTLVEARLRKLDETIERLESKREMLVESRYQTLLKKGQRARRLEAGQTSRPRPATVKGED